MGMPPTVTVIVAGVLGLAVLALAGGSRWYRETVADEQLAHRRARGAGELARLTLVVVLVAALLAVLAEAGPRSMELAAIGLLATLVWAARRPTEDAFAALVIAFGRLLAPGDWVEIGGRRGRVMRRGMFWVRLAGVDGRLWVVPNREIVRSGVQLIASAAADTPVDVLLPVQPGCALRDARERAAICAATSPFASMRKRPETFLDLGEGAGRAHVRVRGYVYDPAYVEAYRSHVVEAWLEGSGGALLAASSTPASDSERKGEAV